MLNDFEVFRTKLNHFLIYLGLSNSRSISGACCLPGQIVSGVDSLWGIMSLGHIVSGAHCLQDGLSLGTSSWGGLSQGTMSPHWIISIYLGPFQSNSVCISLSRSSSGYHVYLGQFLAIWGYQELFLSSIRVSYCNLFSFLRLTWVK